MPRKPKGRLRSVRGQKITKEVEKEDLMRLANIKYVKRNGVANEDGQRVGLASRPTKQSLIEDSNSKCKDTFMTNKNLDALPRGPNKPNSPLGLVSKEMKQSAISNLNNHLLSSSKNIKDTICGDGISLKKETPISMGLKDDWISALGNSKVQGPLKMTTTIHSTNNVESLRSTSVHNQPISRMQTTQAHMQIDHSLMNDVSGNVNDLGSQPTNLYPLEDSNVQRSPLEKSIERSRRPQFKAMEGLVLKENNINRIIMYKACPSRKEGSTSVQAMEGLAEDIDGSSKYNSVMSPRSTGKASSCQGKGPDEGVQRLDVPSSKAMKSEQRYIEIDEDEGRNVNDKNPMGVKAEVNNPACVKDDNKVVVQLENLTCGVMKEQRETKQDIEPNDGDLNLVDVEDDNGGDIRTRFPVKMNNEAANDRGVQSLMGFDDKTYDVKSKGRKESMQEKRYVTLGGGGDDDDDDDSEEVVRLTSGPKKKRRRYIVTGEDEQVEADGVDHDCVGVESKEKEGSKAEAVVSMDCIAKVSMPFIAECVKQQCYCCSKPIDEPVWRGTLKIDGKEYTSLAGHLSTKSCEKVWKLSRSLQTSIEVMKLSRSKVGSKIWDSSKPSDDNIGLYFFPNDMRHDANLDQLINEVMENDLVLQAVIGEAEMLIFPSCLLPERYKNFQRKHYFWALFKRREDNFAVAAKPLNGTAWCEQEEEKGKEHVSNQQDDVDDVEPNQEMILMKSAMPLERQGLVNLHLRLEKQASEGIARGGMDHSVNCKSPAESTQQVSASCVPGATNIGFQLKAPDERKQEDVRCHRVHAVKSTAAATDSAAVIAEATALATNAANIPANHEQFNSSMGVSLGMFFFVARQTSRVEQILQELVREGSLVFAEVKGAGPGPDNIATTVQQ